MKRSLIDCNIDWAIAECEKLHCALPGFAYWTAKDWKEAENTEYMRKVAMGWDVTDYNSGDFDKIGAVLLTIRNGDQHDTSNGMVYCEKYIAMKDGQTLPCHFHYFKTEDIINRAGGTLRVYCWNSKSEAEGFDKDFESDVHVCCDGRPVTVKAGGYVDVTVGNSITLTPYVYHSFEAVGGSVIVGEVSRVNDDANDNHFNPEVIFTKIEEDVEAKYQLCGGYQQ